MSMKQGPKLRAEYHCCQRQRGYAKVLVLSMSAANRDISAQLGSDCPIAAINHDAPMDTSMGLLPLEGSI